MSELAVRIVKLEPMRVASVYGFGREPETAAWHRLEAWAGPKGYLADLDHHRVFGFNNPNPSPRNPNYGYELWITVGEDEEPAGDVRIVDFMGGLYAALRVPVMGRPGETIPAGWRTLHTWCEGSRYHLASHQCLEEFLGLPQIPAGDWTLDLYLAIAE